MINSEVFEVMLVAEPSLISLIHLFIMRMTRGKWPANNVPPRMAGPPQPRQKLVPWSVFPRQQWAFKIYQRINDIEMTKGMMCKNGIFTG